MIKTKTFASSLLICIALGGGVRAQEDAAATAAKNILHALADQKYVEVWNSMVSEWAHSHWLKDTFLAGMAMGRPALGSLVSSVIVAQDRVTHDPSTNVDGDIYAFTFKDTYSTGDFYERLVVIKDPDGVYRLSGIYGTPVPRP